MRRHCLMLVYLFLGCYAPFTIYTNTEAKPVYPIKARGEPYTAEGKFSFLPRNSVGTEYLQVFSDGTYSQHHMLCFADYNARGKATFDGDLLFLQPLQGDTEHIRRRALHMRWLEGRRVLLSDEQFEGFILFPSFEEGFVEYFPEDSTLPDRRILAQQRGFGTYPKELEVEYRQLLRKDRRFLLRTDAEPMSRWLTFLVIWQKTQEPFQCPSPTRYVETLTFKWDGKEHQVKLPSLSPEELEDDCDPWLKLAGWFIKRNSTKALLKG